MYNFQILGKRKLAPLELRLRPFPIFILRECQLSTIDQSSGQRLIALLQKMSQSNTLLTL